MVLSDVLIDVKEQLEMNEEYGDSQNNYARRIAKETGYSRRTVQKALQELEELGVVNRYDDGQRRPAELLVNS